MAEPFVFQFKPGPTGHPEIMYMLDLDCQCDLCGHEQFQRFYHSTPFHSLTLPRLEELADNGSLKAGYECDNCGEAVGANQVRNTTLTFGFADDAGLIRIFDDLDRDERSYEITGHRRLDPQVMPRWETDEDAFDDHHYVLNELDEEIIEELLDRPFNAKLAWIDLLEDWIDDPEGGAFTQLSPDLWIVIDEDDEAAADLAEEIEEDDFWDAHNEGDLAVISLHDSVPTGLTTHKKPKRLPGRWSTWVPGDIYESIVDGELWADAYISRSAAIASLTRAFDTARLKYEQQETAADLFFSEITTPSNTVYGRGISISSILRRAVFTGMTPGEAARLTAEEIIGVLLQVWER